VDELRSRKLMYTLVCLLRAETPLKLFCIANLMLCVDMKGTGGESVLSESWMHYYGEKGHVKREWHRVSSNLSPWTDLPGQLSLELMATGGDPGLMEIGHRVGYFTLWGCQSYPKHSDRYAIIKFTYGVCINWPRCHGEL